MATTERSDTHSGTSSSEPSTATVSPDVEIGSDAGPSTTTAACPSVRETAVDKLPPIGDAVIDSEALVSAIVHLRAVPESAPGSSGHSTPGGAAANSFEQNQQQVRCVIEAFGDDGVRPRARWYAPINDLEDARQPIGTAFSATARWATLEDVARHPYVEKISLEFGQGASFGYFAREGAFDCVEPEQEFSSKVDVVQPQTLTERIAVVVELSQDHLPPVLECDSGDELCDDAIASVWRRVTASTRTLTCVKDWINSILEGVPAPVSYAAQDEWLTFPVLPPFAQLPSTPTAFGVALNWNEVRAASRHPYVAGIWSSSGLTLDELPEGCPPSYSEPSTAPVCEHVAEPLDGKLTEDAVELWSSSEPTVAFDVLVGVRKNYVVCPRPACPGTARQCAELDEYISWIEQVSRASQTCVRALIDDLGGVPSDESFTLGNGFPATLTWAQIQAVASHPDVVSVSVTIFVPPP